MGIKYENRKLNNRSTPRSNNRSTPRSNNRSTLCLIRHVLEIYQTPKVELNVNLEDFKNHLPKADLDVLEEEFEKSLALFNEAKKMVSEERKRRRYLQQLKNKKRLTDVKTKVKLTRKQKRLVDAGTVSITVDGITE
ncbi:hypothetical protein OS493_019535 [Desmophyllum pertusum]|uniref:Uncharacterized protein n=1 Tax=Desmophyllum pertusum TaxID=174260 RepID=A0A9W9ZNB3_9CNID|nr:hypothetical protein OS493_019535 [Desmophyllum pertusum]